MLKIHWIVGLLCIAALNSLPACGQKGVLVLPNEPAARNRATLPQVLTPAAGASSPAPATPASAPQR